MTFIFQSIFFKNTGKAAHFVGGEDPGFLYQTGNKHNWNQH